MRIVDIIAAVLVSCSTTTAAHPISMSEVVVDLRPAKATAELRVMIEDLILYYPLQADGELRYSAADLRDAAQKHQQFLLRDFHLRDETGTRIQGKITRLDAGQIGDDGVLQSQLKKRWLTYVIEFDWKRPPAFITVSQNFGGDKAVLPSLMDCTVLQNDVLLDTSHQLAAKTPWTIKLDWKNPPKRPKNWRELRARKEKQRQARLGIASYSGLYSFIYITGQEVRHEVLIPVLTLETWAPLPRRSTDFLEISEQRRAKKIIEKFLKNRNPVRINGARVQPLVTKTQFFGLDISDFAQNARPRRLGIHQARVGVIMTYPAESIPHSVEMRWNTFSEHAPFLRSIVYIDTADAVEHFFRPSDPVYQWKRTATFRKRTPIRAVRHALPTASSPQIQSQQSEKICHALLKNVYRSFDYRGDHEIYDALAKSVDGELLRTLYLQFMRSLLMAEQGGARSRVEKVKVVSHRLVESKAGEFQQHCAWRVRGTVEHWGHVHTRENQYTATFTITATPAGWKVTRCTINDQKRVRFETRIRGMAANSN